MTLQIFFDFIKAMKKCILFIFSLFLLFALTSQKLVFADVPNLDYFKAKCNPDEIETVCTWSRINIDSPIIDKCVQYEKDLNYRFLSGTGSTFGGTNKYCFKLVSIKALISHYLKSFLPLFITTALFELPIFFAFGLRSTKAMLVVSLINLLSVSLSYYVTTFLTLNTSLKVLLMEFVIIVFEATLIKLKFKRISTKRIIIASIIANITSALLGTIALYLIPLLIKHTFY